MDDVTTMLADMEDMTRNQIDESWRASIYTVRSLTEESSNSVAGAYFLIFKIYKKTAVIRPCN